MASLTEEEQELIIFKLANEKGKFAIDINTPGAGVQLVLERGFDGDWWRLIDVCVTAHSQSHVVRVFKLTEAGYARFRRILGIKEQQCAPTSS